MARKSKPRLAINPRSAATVLIATGNRVPRGIPAHNLSGADLLRIGQVRNGVAGDVPDLVAIANELVATGAFVRAGWWIEKAATPPITAPEPVKPTDPIDEAPAIPAEEE